MTNITKGIFASIMALAVAGDGARAKADHDLYRHIDQLAVDIKVKSDLIIEETKHYRSTPNYGRMIGGAYRLRGLAESTCVLARNQGNIYALESSLRQLDAAFHHLEDVFDETELQASRGYGRIRGNTAHVKELLCAIEDCIHEMRDDVRALRRPSTCVQRRPYGDYYSGGSYTRSPYGSDCDLPRSYGRGIRIDSGHRYGDHGGISFGNGNLNFRIKF